MAASQDRAHPGTPFFSTGVFPLRPLLTILKRILLSAFAILALFALGAGWVWLSTRQEEVAFQSGNITIRGTLLSPRFGSGAPGVVLVHGSGQTSRKSTMLYAWIFASQRYAALAYDKRGVGKSEGGSNEWSAFSLDDLASDAAAGYRFLQSRKGVDPKRVGFFGASQGGWVVSLAANRVDMPAFVVMVSASVSTVAEDRLYGREAEIRHAGFGSDAVGQGIELMRLDHQVTRSGQGYEQLLAAADRYHVAEWFRAINPGLETPLPADAPHRIWERKVLDFDPQPLLGTLTSPVLWVFGDPALDRFSPVRLSLSRVEQAKASGMPYDTIQIGNVGHTLELEGGRSIQTLVQVRLPLIRKMFRWLDVHAKGRG